MKNRGIKADIVPKKFVTESLYEELMQIVNENYNDNILISRANNAIFNLVRETKLNIADLIYNLFIVEGENIEREISSLPDVYHFSLDMLEDEIK